MQATTQAPPPAIPQPTAITTVGADGKPQTITIPKELDEIQTLVSQRRELSQQLNNVTTRRSELVNQIRSAPDGPARTGLEEHLKVLDQRILQLESQLATTGQQLAGAPADLVRIAEEHAYTTGNSDAWEEGLAVGGGTVLAFFVIIGAWKRFRGKRRRRQSTPALAESDARMERLERGMEAIAIEVERISEGQRFVTRILSESKPLAEAKQLSE